MDQAKFDRVAAIFLRLDRALNGLRTGMTEAEQSEAWSNFCVNFRRVYIRMGQAVRTDKCKSWYYGQIVSKRNTDPLLNYIWHARNADEHVDEDIGDAEGGVIQISAPRGAKGPTHLIPTNDGIKFTGPRPVTEFVPGQFTLRTVTDRGVDYPVPTEHDGKQIGTPSALQAAELAYEHLKGVIGHAEKEFGTSANTKGKP